MLKGVRLKDDGMFSDKPDFVRLSLDEYDDRIEDPKPSSFKGRSAVSSKKGKSKTGENRAKTTPKIRDASDRFKDDAVEGTQADGREGESVCQLRGKQGASCGYEGENRSCGGKVGGTVDGY